MKKQMNEHRVATDGDEEYWRLEQVLWEKSRVWF